MLFFIVGKTKEQAISTCLDWCSAFSFLSSPPCLTGCHQTHFPTWGKIVKVYAETWRQRKNKEEVAPFRGPLLGSTNVYQSLALCQIDNCMHPYFKEFLKTYWSWVEIVIWMMMTEGTMKTSVYISQSSLCHPVSCLLCIEFHRHPYSK